MVSSFGPQSEVVAFMNTIGSAGNRQPCLLRMIPIVEADGDELADACVRHAEARVAAHDGQRFRLHAREARKVPGREHRVVDLGDDLREVADVAIRVGKAGLLTARGAVAQELHCSSPRGDAPEFTGSSRRRHIPPVPS
jgi:hypothetical protein